MGVMRTKGQLTERRERCVCKMCGGKLEIRLIIHNQYGGQGLDLYCPQCDRIEYGTEPGIYEIAKAFADRFEFNYFVEMAEGQRNFQLNISKLCDIIAWAFAYAAKQGLMQAYGDE